MLNASVTSVVCDDGEIYFKAKDVAEALGYENPREAIRLHVWGKNKFEWEQLPLQKEGERISPLHPRTVFLTEPGVYQLVFRSAEAFQDWVFSEVLPSIRKTGSYSMNGLHDALGTMTLSILSGDDKDRLKEYKTVLRTHSDTLKDPVTVERGRRGGEKAQENRRKLVEFKNMFHELYTALFGPDD